jgi:hypothetical protein
MKALALALALNATPIVRLPGQTRQHDLPAAFRSVAGVTLNRDSAATIRAKLGATVERQVGTGHDVLASWCYVARTDASPVLLELMSDMSDMGTQGRALNVIRLRDASAAEDRAGCARLPSSSVLSTRNGLRLGLTAKAVQGLLGKPARMTGDSLVYEFEAKEYMPRRSREYRHWNTPELRKSCFEGGPPYASVGGTAIIRIVDDRVAEIRLERYDQATC